MYFWGITNLEIKDLSIAYCGCSSVRLSASDKENISVAILLQNIILFKLSNITVKNSSGFGVMGSNIFGIFIGVSLKICIQQLSYVEIETL